MKTFYPALMVLSIFLSSFSSLSAFAENPVKSKVSAVTVFRQGAVIQRSGNVNIPNGRSTLIFNDLPSTLIGQSLQFSASGNFTVLSIQNEVKFTTQKPPTQDIKRLEQRKKQFNQQLKREQTILKVTQEESQIIQLANPLLSQSDSGLSVLQLTAAADLYRDRLRKLRLEALDIEQQIGILQDTISKLHKAVQQLNVKSNQQSYTEVRIAIDAPRTLNSSFELSYLINEASWKPTYDIKVEHTDQPVVLGYKANVHQQSGEDWKNVMLTLSTGNPNSYSLPPVMNPWWLNTHPPVATTQKSLGNITPDRMIREESADLKEVSVADYAATGPVVQTVDQLTTFQFEIKTPYDILSNNKSHVVHIGNHDLKADYEYYAAPKLNPYAFLTARVTGWERLRLLSGEANLFFEGTYLGTSQINPNIAQDTLSFSLGKDEGITITREKGKKYSEKQFIGNKQTKTIAWDIEIRNNKRQPISIVIEDQYPVSMSEDIEIELIKSRGATTTASKGKLKWELDLSAGKRKTLSFEYEVKYPKAIRLALE